MIVHNVLKYRQNSAIRAHIHTRVSHLFPNGVYNFVTFAPLHLSISFIHFGLRYLLPIFFFFSTDVAVAAAAFNLNLIIDVEV